MSSEHEQWCKRPAIFCLERFRDSRVHKFVNFKLESSYVRSCERPCFGSVDPGSEPFLYQDVVDLTVIYSVR